MRHHISDQFPRKRLRPEYYNGQRLHLLNNWNFQVPSIWIQPLARHPILGYHRPWVFHQLLVIDILCFLLASTWENAVFNVAQAADIAGENKPDVTSEPLPTSTTTASSPSGVSVGAIVGGVIGGAIIIIIGGLFIFWVRRRRRQRTHTPTTGGPSFNPSQSVTVPLIWNRTPAQPSPAPITPYLTSPVHSTTSLALTSLVSPVSPGFSSSGHSAAPPITDAADMIAPFLATSSRHQSSRSNTSPPTSKAAEALSERVTSPPGQRARLNPPSYSASVEPGSSGAAITWSRRPSTKKHRKQEGSVSGATTYSGHSRTSTRESLTTVRTGSRLEQSRPRAAAPSTGTVRSLESAVNAGGVGSVDGGGVEMNRRAGVSDQRPPAV
ncbi:hypothetical protein J3R83DRAFT_7225 [Lanmaoa asiatica]|nr:hypothetical protein J3R83DRAFT_7225 [Lanmaoa asiatica]